MSLLVARFYDLPSSSLLSLSLLLGVWLGFALTLDLVPRVLWALGAGCLISSCCLISSSCCKRGLSLGGAGDGRGYLLSKGDSLILGGVTRLLSI
jgi:hypothetical protein